MVSISLSLQFIALLFPLHFLTWASSVAEEVWVGIRRRRRRRYECGSCGCWLHGWAVMLYCACDDYLCFQHASFHYLFMWAISGLAEANVNRLEVTGWPNLLNWTPVWCLWLLVECVDFSSQPEVFLTSSYLSSSLMVLLAEISQFCGPHLRNLLHHSSGKGWNCLKSHLLAEVIPFWILPPWCRRA